MEGGVESDHLGDVGEDVGDGVDAEEVGGIVKRREVAAEFDLAEDVFIYKGAAGEEIGTLDDSVADCLHVGEGLEDAELGVDKGVHDEFHADYVVGDGKVADEAFLAGGAMFYRALGEADLFYETFGKKVVHFVALHIKELILDGGAAAIDY
jgi:hypothetical protein